MLAALTDGSYESRMPRALTDRRAAHVTCIVLLAFLAYAGSFRGGWVSDDTTAVAENPQLRSLSFANLRTIATSFDDANYIPLKVLSLAIDYHLWGGTPAGYHATNLALHIANALAIYALLLRLGESGGAALVIALLWALHPVQVESVAWISERKNVLSTLFFFAALLSFLAWSARPRLQTYALLFVFFVCALLSKINTIVLPAIMLAHELVEHHRLRGRDLAATVPLFAVGAVLAWVNLVGNPSHGAAWHGDDFWVNLRTTSTVVPRYLGLVFVPVGLSFYYDVVLRSSWLDPPVLLGVVTVVGLVATAVVLLARRRREAFWVIWFGVTLSPMLNLVPFPARMADRYLYIPLLGLVVLLVWGGRALAARLPPLHRALPAFAAAAVVILGVLTAARVPVFADEISLWADWAVRVPYLSADRPYGPKPRPRELAILREALARDGSSAVLHNAIGAIAFEENRLDEAVAELARARLLDPRDRAIALNLGRAYMYSGQPAAAARAFEDAVRLEPASFFAQLNLARAYLQLGDTRRARPPLERARSMRPDWKDWRREWSLLEQLERQ
jgi:tetratricopeptide (TPR) repeat protein